MTDKIFEKFADDLFNVILENDPQAGSGLGLHEYDGRIGDVSEKGMENELRVYKEYYDRLISIERKELSAINRYDYDMAKWAIESALFYFEEIKSYKHNPRFYINIFSGLDNYMKREYQPFDERLISVIKIMDRIPDTLETAENNLGNSLPAVFCKYAIHSASGFEDFFNHKLLEEIKERSSNEDLITEYKRTSNEAVKAFEKFSKFIDTVNSATDDSYRLGKDKFLKMLRVTEHIDLPFEELKKTGLDELKRLQDELNLVIKENDFEGKLDTLDHDHPTEDNLIGETNNMLNELVEFIRINEIVDLPEKLNCIVTEMPKYDDFGFAAMGTAGPFEKSDESFYYVNLPDKDWDEKKKEEWLTQFNYPALSLISIHEAYPGHYTHFLNANEKSTKLSKLFMSYSYVEGWAHYTEEMMIEQGFRKDDFKSRIGMLQEALIRCCRYNVAIGIHCENMTLEDAKNYFLENAYMTETTAMQEAERGAFDPGYLNYTLGKIYLKKFKEKYFNKFKDTKTIKDFHNQIVSLGCPTYRIAEDFVIG
jgi:uncharacterized protein (DUF885 family)